MFSRQGQSVHSSRIIGEVAEVGDEGGLADLGRIGLLEEGEEQGLADGGVGGRLGRMEGTRACY